MIHLVDNRGGQAVSPSTLTLGYDSVTGSCSPGAEGGNKSGDICSSNYCPVTDNSEVNDQQIQSLAILKEIRASE